MMLDLVVAARGRPPGRSVAIPAGRWPGKASGRQARRVPARGPPMSGQIAWTWSACRPWGPCRVAYSTFWFSARVR